MDANELGRLLDEHATPLVLFARQWCATPEDVVQEAFIKLASQRRPPQKPEAWLYRVVRNTAVSVSRSSRRRKKRESKVARKNALWFQPKKDGYLDAAEATNALETLPVEEREIIVAHLWGGLSFDQIAEVAGCSSSTAHRRYISGLQSLRERLQIPCPSRMTNDR